MSYTEYTDYDAWLDAASRIWPDSRVIMSDYSDIDSNSNNNSGDRDLVVGHDPNINIVGAWNADSGTGWIDPPSEFEDVVTDSPSADLDSGVDGNTGFIQ